MRRSGIGWLLIAAILAGVGGGARAGDKPFQRTPDFQKRVDASIARGVSWLRSAVSASGWEAGPGEIGPGENGVYGGGPALVYHALRICGVPADDPAASASFEAMRRQYAGRRTSPKDSKGEPLTTPDYGVMCMAVADHGDPMAASDVLGERMYRLSAEDLAWMTEMVRVLEDSQDSRGMWPIFPLGRSRGGSSSGESVDTQIALLGLKAASRAGVRAGSATWLKSLQHYVDTQAPKGKYEGRGWPLSGVPTGKDEWGGYPWTTAGGVSAVAICRSELFGDPKYPKALDARAATAVRDGLAWLGGRASTFEVMDAELVQILGSTRGFYDEAYAVERAGDLAHADRMGGHDWFGEQSEALLALQSKNGAWGADQPKGKQTIWTMTAADIRAGTCFALLALARGTLPVLTHPFDDSDVNFSVVPALSDADFADFVDLILSRWTRVADAAAKDRLFAKTTAVGPRIVAPLLKQLASDKDDVRASAFALLARATGLDQGYDPAAKPEDRAAAVARWQAWWTENAATARYDAASGRIVAGAK